MTGSDRNDQSPGPGDPVSESSASVPGRVRRKADPHLRILATMIDIAIFLFFVVISGPFGVVIGAAYLLVRDGWNGRSLGKILVGLQVVTFIDGRPAGLRESLLRNIPLAIVAVLSVVTIFGWVMFFTVGPVTFGWTLYQIYTEDSGRRTGDLLAHTAVIEIPKTSA